jgi:hypothetical protein
VRILSPQGDLVAISRWEAEDRDGGPLNPDGVVLRPLRVFLAPEPMPGEIARSSKAEEKSGFCDRMIERGSRGQTG